MAGKNVSCEVLPCSIEHDSFVFVSYAHADAQTVFPIIERVHAGGYAIWYDKGITISSTWTDEIAIAIKRCKVLLLFVSRHSMESTYVRSEVEFALNQKIRVIPVYLDSMDVLPPGLALGLNATQGVMEIDSPQIVAQQICKALDYNKVRKESEPVVLPDAVVKKRLPLLYLGATVLVVLLAALFLFLFRPASPIQLEKTVFAPAESIYVVLNAITPEQIKQGAILVVVAEGAKPEEYVDRKRVDMEEFYTFRHYHPEWGEKYVLQLHAPVAGGKYTLRLHAPDKELTPASLVGEARITVAGDSLGAFAIATNKTSFAPYERIIVRTSGVSQRMIKDGALVGLFKKDKPGNWLTYDWAKERDEEKFFDAPKEPGEYEIQAHINNQVMDEPTLVARVPILVLPQPEDAR
ncbi:MAG: toll/interleukin-1 receptor domain-containing protein [Azoarcus sp.]|nr:toll/interleukin-1 receptor domain-containing protein [Azoarcus sp.]